VDENIVIVNPLPAIGELADYLEISGLVMPSGIDSIQRTAEFGFFVIVVEKLLCQLNVAFPVATKPERMNTFVIHDDESAMLQAIRPRSVSSPEIGDIDLHVPAIEFPKNAAP
jgi:hypothetical protein